MEADMARKPTARLEFAMFDVFYKDGSQRSNRRVPKETLGAIDGEAAVRAAIEEQDRQIAEKSGIPAPDIDRILKSGTKERQRRPQAAE
jgi:hypothetical protein